MKKYLTIIAFFILLSGFGQTAIKKSSLSTAGGSHTTGSTTVIYALGEVAIQEHTQGNVSVSEGFIGPDLQALGIEDYGVLEGIQVYPNPVRDIFTVSLPANQSYEYYLYDLNGKQIWAKTGISETEQFNIARLHTAMYVLVVIDRDHQRKKIIKLQKE